MQLRSTPSLGSTFTLYLPQTYIGPSVSNMVVTDSKAVPLPPPHAFPAVHVSEHRLSRSWTTATPCSPTMPCC